jgi:hypothetical protein
MDELLGSDHVIARINCLTRRSELRGNAYQPLQELNDSIDDAIASLQQLQKFGFITPQSMALFDVTLEHTRVSANKEAIEVLHEYHAKDVVRFERRRRQLATAMDEASAAPRSDDEQLPE